MVQAVNESLADRLHRVRAAARALYPAAVQAAPATPPHLTREQIEHAARLLAARRAGVAQ
jgi:hypothetical protein